jgi:hypothetical protein
LVSPSPCPRRPPSSSWSRHSRRTSQRNRGRRLLPPLILVEGAAAPPPPDTPAQLGDVVAAGLPHTREASDLLGTSHLDADALVQRSSS